MVVPEEKSDKGQKEDLKQKKNSPKLPKFNVRHPYTHQIQQTPTRINKKRVRAWYIIIKLSKVRQREP